LSLLVASLAKADSLQLDGVRIHDWCDIGTLCTFSGGGTGLAYFAGAGLQLASNTFSINFPYLVQTYPILQTDPPISIINTVAVNIVSMSGLTITQLTVYVTNNIAGGPLNSLVATNSGSAGLVFYSGNGGPTGYWDAATGMLNPMTARGDLIIGQAFGVPIRLSLGTNGQVLTVQGSSETWVDPTGGGGSTVSNSDSSLVSTIVGGVIFLKLPSSNSGLSNGWAYNAVFSQNSLFANLLSGFQFFPTNLSAGTIVTNSYHIFYGTNAASGGSSTTMTNTGDSAGVLSGGPSTYGVGTNQTGGGGGYVPTFQDTNVFLVFDATGLTTVYSSQLSSISGAIITPSYSGINLVATLVGVATNSATFYFIDLDDSFSSAGAVTCDSFCNGSNSVHFFQ
jgi:hypothetical protein